MVLVSLHDPDARPIRKGRIDRPVEFGYKAQVVDNADGIVPDYNVKAEVKWRIGSEGRISHLKHAYGWNRSRLDGRAGGCGYGVFAHNLTKIGTLAS